MNNKGLTLIEIVIALAILSLVLVSYVSLYGNIVILTSDSEEITNDTFALQEIMENSIFEKKEDFVQGETEDYEVTIFSDDYESTVPVMEIEEVHINDRRYVTLVSNVESEVPDAPDITFFDVGAFNKSDTNFNTHVFPWYDDNIVLAGSFEFGSDPKIYENRERWYQSKELIENPVFASDYLVISEKKEETPIAGLRFSNFIDKNDLFEKNKFYYYEIMPYTLAGRVSHKKNEKRIIAYDTPSSIAFKALLEGFYPKTSSGETIIFDHDGEIYPEVMQNINQATLDLGWSKNSDPEGALVGTRLPTAAISENLDIGLTFDVNESLIPLEETTELLHGIFFGNNNNSGDMITFDVMNNVISIDRVINGEYVSNKMEINLLTDAGFSDFRDTNDAGEVVFDWSQLYALEMEYLHNTNDIEFLLAYVDETNSRVESDPVTFNCEENPPDYIGFKTHSNLDYIPDPLGLSVNTYERNYVTRYYDFSISASNQTFVTQGEFIDDSRIAIEFFDVITSEVNVEKDLDGSGTIESDEVLIYFDNGYTINSATKTDDKVITIEIDETFSMIDRIEGIDLYLDYASVSKFSEGYLTVTNGMPYKVQENLESVFSEDFDDLNVSDFNDAFTNGDYLTYGWYQYRNGNIELRSDGSNNYLTKEDENDPRGAYKTLDNTISNEAFVAALKIRRESGGSGGSLDRVSISNNLSDDNTNDLIEGYGIRVADNAFIIERRQNNGNFTQLSSESFNRVDDTWYNVKFYWQPSGELTARIYDESDNLLQETIANDVSFNNFDSFYIHGGHDFSLDNIIINKVID